MLADGTDVGPYRILALLGAGGMGEVYRARDTRLGREVALKVLPSALAGSPDRIRRFEQEARAAGALSHPNVCATFDVGAHEGSPFLVMELLEGESLRARLEQGAIPVRKAIDWVAQTAHGLAAAHEKGIVHRDLKPENLFLTKDGRVKVLDFGLAKLTRPEIAASPAGQPVSAAPSATGEILGTIGYMAPEQLRGEPVDQRADLFALGAILYELLTGRRAFPGVAFHEMAYRIVNEDPPPLDACGRDLPAGCEAIVRRCLEKVPAERFQSARDLAFALAGLAQHAAPPRPAGGGGRGARRWRPVATIALGLAALGIGFLAGSVGRGERGAAPAIPGYARLTADRGRIFSARFAPGSNSIVYAAAWGGRPIELFEVRLGQTASRAIGLGRANLLSIARDGALAITLAHERFTGWPTYGTLAEAPLAGGQPRRILDGVLSGDWAPDGRTLAISRFVGGSARLELPAGRALYASSGQLGWVRVSPSGEWVAFVENPVPPDTRGRVVIVDRQGRVAGRTAEWNAILGLAWSADGRDAWYCASQDGADSELRTLAPGGAQRLVDRFPGYMVLHDIAPDGRLLLAREHIEAGIRGRRSPRDEERELGWLDWSTAYGLSADGKTLLFDEQGLGGGPYYAVCLRDMDGSLPVRLGEGHGCALSPDGRTVLVIHFGVPNRLLLMPTGAGAAVTLPSGTVEKYQGGRWLPDGRGVVFSGSEPGRPWRAWIQDTAGGLPRPVSPEGIAGVIVSPDGRRLAATDRTGQLFICALDGGTPARVADLRPDEIVLGWTPDGRSLCLGEKGTSMAVSKLDLGTGRRRPSDRFALPDPAGACVWNAFLTPDGAGYAYSYLRWVDELYLVDGVD